MPEVVAARRQRVKVERREEELSQAIRASEHSPVRRGALWSCTSCGTAPLKGNQAVLKWLRSSCQPLLQPEQTAMQGIRRPSVGSNVQIGGLKVHESHTVQYFPCGWWACTACGNTGREVLKDLGQKCPGREGRRRAGQQNLDRLSAGWAPGNSQAARAYNDAHGKPMRRR